MRYKRLGLGLEFLVIILLISQLVNAFAVTTFYWDEKPLTMYPGQTKDAYVLLQNTIGDEDIKLEGEITSGSEIATLLEPNRQYLVPVGKKDVKVDVRITVPEDVPLQSRYYIGISFKQIVEKEGKMVQMTGALGTKIPVEIVSVSEVPAEKEKPEIIKEGKTRAIISLLILAIVVIALIIYITSRKKNPKKEKVNK
jgi:hypothetical protein